jgi:DNA processing protein
MKPSELLYNIAITKIDSVGPILGKSLISYCGSSEAVFLEKKHRLMKIPGVGEHVANQIIKSDALVKAEEEMKL